MQDDEIVIIQEINCGFCSINLGSLTLPQRQAHYDGHFLKDSTDNEGLEEMDGRVAATPVGSYTDPIIITEASSSNKTQWGFPRERDNFWYSEQKSVPPPNFTPGLIPLIRKGLLKGQNRQLVRRAVLCNPKTVHIHREAWDASWGCGYRNFLMVCTVLMSQNDQPLYFPLLDTPPSPTVRNLQTWIESAWKEGFDPEGHQQLKNLVGTKKWIGTADLWVAFSYRGIPAELVDFDLRKNPQGSKILIDWVIDYFTVKESTDGSPKNAFESMKIPQITITEKMPIILQHDGHSRTIVGYEIDKKGVPNLLTFDPGFRPPTELRTASLQEFSQHQTPEQQKPSSSELKRRRSESSDDIVILEGKSRSPEKKNLFKDTFPRVGAAKDLDLYAMTRKFRLDPNTLNKKKQYQVLYFPMTAPLTDYERRRRKTVTSTKLS